MRPKKIVRVTHVEPAGGKRLALRFDDGSAGVADVSSLLVGPAFEELRRDDAVFAQVTLDGHGSIAWPSGADLDSWVLYELAVSTAAS